MFCDGAASQFERGRHLVMLDGEAAAQQRKLGDLLLRREIGEARGNPVSENFPNLRMPERFGG